MVEVNNVNTNTIQPELLTAAEVAKLLGFSIRTVWRDVSGKRLIEPIYIGSKPRWRRSELINWIAQGCPPLTSDHNFNTDQ